MGGARPAGLRMALGPSSCRLAVLSRRDEDEVDAFAEFGAAEKRPTGLPLSEVTARNELQPVRFGGFQVSIRLVFRPVFPATSVARVRAGLGIQVCVPPGYWRYFKDFTPNVKTPRRLSREPDNI